MKAQDIIWIVLCFTAATSIADNLQIFQVSTPSQNVQVGGAEITQLVNQSTGTLPDDEVAGSSSLWKAISFIISSFVSFLYVIPILTKYGVSLAISIPIQTLVTFSEGWALYGIWTGRGTKIMD